MEHAKLTTEHSLQQNDIYISTRLEERVCNRRTLVPFCCPPARSQCTIRSLLRQQARQRCDCMAIALTRVNSAYPPMSYMQILKRERAPCDERKISFYCPNPKYTLTSDARVLALGPKFMSVYIYKLAMERRIYFDEIEGLVAEWFEATGTLLLDIYSGKCSQKRWNHGKYRTVEDVALLVNPANVISSNINQEFYDDILCEVEERLKGEFLTSEEIDFDLKDLPDNGEIEPAVLPLTLRLLSSVPVSVHAVGGDNRPPDIAVRFYLSSYLT
eukprot:Gb_36975 [translate_table: standard]